MTTTAAPRACSSPAMSDKGFPILRENLTSLMGRPSAIRLRMTSSVRSGQGVQGKDDFPWMPYLIENLS